MTRSRIHAQNLINFGVLPLTFADPADYDRVDAGDELAIVQVVEQIRGGRDLTIENRTKDHKFRCTHAMSPRQVELVVARSLISFLRNRVVGLAKLTRRGGEGRMSVPFHKIATKRV